jgi:hypothetical protein
MMRSELVVTAIFAMALGCSSGGGSSGVEGTKTVSTLDETDKAAFCDWLNGKLAGGYDKPIVCGGETIDHTDSSQAECVQDFPTCDATVAQLEGCLGKAIDVKCDQAALAQAKASADCVAASDCL